MFTTIQLPGYAEQPPRPGGPTMTALQAVARGEQPPDLMVVNGQVFQPRTGEYASGDLLVAGGRIAGLVEDGMADADRQTTVVDAEGQAVLPGFIDAHTHCDMFQAFEHAAGQALAGGTTTVLTETDRFARRLGPEAITEFLAATAELPVRVFATLPADPFLDGVPGKAAAVGERDALLALAGHPRVAGVGELFWNQVAGRETALAPLLETVRAVGGVVWGHGAGCHDRKLSAFASVVDNDHELLTAGDVAPRVARGITPIGRCGSIRDDSALLGATDEQLLRSEGCLCSDGMWPTELLAEGYMDHVVRQTIAAGVSPEVAFRMATLNAARHCRLDGLGTLTPGAHADVIVLSDVERVSVETVISDGAVVVEGGTPQVTARPHEYPPAWYETAAVAVEPERFRVDADKATEGSVRAIGYVGGLLSESRTVRPAREGDELVAAPRRDVLQVALLPGRQGAPDAGFTGFVTGLGLEQGAVATSNTWGNPGVLVLGADADSMALAATQLSDLGGGWVVVGKPGVMATLPTPLAGVCSETSPERTRARMASLRGALADAGVGASQPLVAIGTLTAVGLPWFKLGLEGYVDVVGERGVGLAV